MNPINKLIRRDFLKTSLALGAAFSAMDTRVSFAQAEEVSKPKDRAPVTSEELFRKGLVGPAQLSLASSKLAAEKANDKKVKGFASFELAEAIAVSSILKDMDTPMPEPGAMIQSKMEKLSNADGADFDRAYIKSQIETHEFLRDHAMDYLKNSSGDSMAEKHGRHLATLALTTFKEHLAICEHIAQDLQA